MGDDGIHNKKKKKDTILEQDWFYMLVYVFAVARCFKQGGTSYWYSNHSMILHCNIRLEIMINIGASDGIGKETVLGLAGMKPKMIIMACRESDKAKQAHRLVCDKYAAEGDKQSVVLEFIDLADLSSIKNFVGRLLDKSLMIDILINNAGIILSEKQHTKDGFEMQVNGSWM